MNLTADTEFPGRVSYAFSRLRRHGARETARRVATLTLARLYFQDIHLWYVLDLTQERPPAPLAPGMTWHRSGESDLPDLERLSDMAARTAHQRLYRGMQLWLMRDGDVPVFACWIHHGRRPLFAGRVGWLALPPGVAAVEESVTAPDYRGRRIAPMAWSLLRSELKAQGDELMVTTVESDNVPVQRALVYAGFVCVGAHRLRRLGPWVEVRVRGTDHPFVSHLAAELTR